MNSSPTLVTGAAGFIGMHCSARLLAQGHQVIGIDNLNDYYDPRLKQARLAQLTSQPGFRFMEMDIANRDALEKLFAEVRPERVLHLAAQAGVRYSLKNPHAYVQSNLVGFVNILEGCRHHGVQHLVYASSSSVYGGNKKLPFSETDRVDNPISLYAATKKANELMAHTYSHLFGIPATGLRFFTVYGPWGRPDMAAFIFTKAILAGRPITVFNHGKMERDFTFIDDIVQGVVRALDRPPVSEPAQGNSAFEMSAPYRVLNIGNHNPEPLTEFISAIEDALGVKAKQDLQPIQPGDVPATYAETSSLRALTGFAPETPLREGIAKFVRWYREYYGV